MSEPILLANLHNFIKKKARTQIFSCKLIEILENIYLRTPTNGCLLNTETKTSVGKEDIKKNFQSLLSTL